MKSLRSKRLGGDDSGGCGCGGCLTFMLIFWLLFMGGCNKLIRLVELKTNEAEKNIVETSKLKRENELLKLKIQQESLKRELKELPAESLATESISMEFTTK